MTNEYLTTEELCGFTEEGYEDELWGVIPGYENYYVSTKGRVWSCKHGIFLRHRLNSKGYPTVGLSFNGEQKQFCIHRIEALTFIPNPDYLPMVRHLDDNKLNNNINNLAWGNCSDNLEDAIRNRHRDNVLRPIIAINNNTGIGYYYSSCAEASRDLGHHTSTVSNCLAKGSNIGHYRLVDADETYLYDNIQNGDPVRHLFPTQERQKMQRRPKQSTKVRCTRCDDGEELIFNNIIEAVKFFDSPYQTIKNTIYEKRKHKGFYMEYVY